MNKNQALNTKNSEEPDDPKSLTQQGYTKYKEGKADEAIDLYLKAININPNYALARSNLGHAYKKKEMFNEAIKEWEEVLKRGASGSITIPIPGNIDDAKRLLKEQKNKNKDKDLPGVAKILRKQIKQLEKEDANWRDIYPKIVKIGDTAVPALTKALGGKNETLQLRAMELLAKIGGDDAMNAIKSAYKKGNENLCFYIKRIFTDIDEQVKDELNNLPEKKWWQFWKN